MNSALLQQVSLSFSRCAVLFRVALNVHLRRGSSYRNQDCKSGVALISGGCDSLLFSFSVVAAAAAACLVELACRMNYEDTAGGFCSRQKTRDC